MDDWSVSDLAWAAARDRAPNHTWPVTAPLTSARSFMDEY